jgi:hypothetical protein
VAVDSERLRVAAGEAVVWPAGIVHGAWTEHSHMRAFVVELAGADGSLVQGVLPGTARPIGPGEAVEPAEGSLAERPTPEERLDRTSGEPL